MFESTSKCFGIQKGYSVNPKLIYSDINCVYLVCRRLYILDPEMYNRNPVSELSRIYRYVRRIMDHLEKVASRPKLESEMESFRQKIKAAQLEPLVDDKAAKKAAKNLKGLHRKLEGTKEKIEKLKNHPE